LAAFIIDEMQTGRFVRQRIFVKGKRLTWEDKKESFPDS
jgi:hypothetical protein